ncbi:response regulator [Caviibacter abscessus]|uniref:response regulator n=1 Tax=Caviibacter abscessus TaxID=1766719 RepID=UPI00082ABC57|nr:response regulator [Caviibacter abscessus]
MKIALVVDDSSYFRQNIKNILEEYNFNVIEAKDGIQAVELYKKYKPDITTMDINMPRLDGFGAISQILDYDKQAKILICSSMMFLDIYIAEGLEAGAKACICKPFTKNEFISAISDILVGDK